MAQKLRHIFQANR